jgi:putative hydrolase of the HAD superfamily
MTGKNSIKNIIFDISGVFLTLDEKSTLEYYAKKLKVPLEKICKVHESLITAYDTNNIKDDEFLKKLFNGINRKVDKNYWKKKLSMKKSSPEMFEFLEKIKKKYPVYFVTNEGSNYWKSVDKKFKIHEKFNGGIASYEVSVSKPDIKIFQALCKKFRLQPEDCLFLDDKEKNLGGAEKLGMKTLVFTDIEHLKKDFDRLGIQLS